MAADLRERFARIHAMSALSNRQKIALMLAFALSIAAVSALWLATRTREYRPLYADMSGQDGATVRAVLDKAGIPYRGEAGFVSVPAAHLDEARSRLAAEGLPKSTSAGFELLDNSRFGASQFAEQIKYQRALEGELKRSIELVEAVQAARVHLAIPRASAFLREQQAPSASVLLTLRSGRTLDATHVSGIVQLVASSVPGLSAHRVTVVDSRGALLSAPSRSAATPSEPDYAAEIESDLVRRIEDLLAPLAGAQKVRVQASAEVGPVVQATDESAADSAPATHAGPAANSSTPAIAPSVGPSAPTLRRLAVSVILDHRSPTGSAPRPWTAAELAQAATLVRDAMGFNTARGDTLNVVNTPFATAQAAATPLPWWREPAIAELGRDLVRYGLLSLLVVFLVLALIRPLLNELARRQAPLKPLPEAGGSDYRPTREQSSPADSRDPRAVADVIKTWMRDNE